ncbi:SDR family oxidoreductase [Deltaproteobacteria bacterium TL4]
MSALTLVTGATGFIGSQVVLQLLKSGASVRVLVRTPEKLADFGLQSHPELNVCRGDLLDPKTIASALEGVETIYHIAGFISTLHRDQEKIHQLNYDITKNLFDACKQHSISKIVYLASIFGLGGGTQAPVNEETPFNLNYFPVDYVQSKRKIEIYARQCAKEGLPLVFMYPGFCYGPGDVYISSSRMIELFLQRKLPAYIPGGQNAMDVRDAAQGLILGMKKGQIGERYIIGGDNKTYQELFKILSQLTHLSAPRIKLPPKVGQIVGGLMELIRKDPLIDFQSATMMGQFWYYDSSKATRELGYQTRPLQETFRDAIIWFCENGRAPWPSKSPLLEQYLSQS